MYCRYVCDGFQRLIQMWIQKIIKKVIFKGYSKEIEKKIHKDNQFVIMLTVDVTAIFTVLNVNIQITHQNKCCNVVLCQCLIISLGNFTHQCLPFLKYS